MRILVSSSALTFAPQNYDGFILSILRHPNVAGLLLDDNRDPSFLIKAAALIASGAAPRFGVQLWKNYFGSSIAQRRQLCTELGKSFYLTPNFNSETTLKWIEEQQIDLILNARTRTFFRKKILQIPPRGCWNIHHGLLPDQRGLMCDFWSHLDQEPVGFSIHQMTPKLDDGPIVKTCPVRTDKKDYLGYVFEASKREAEVCAELFNLWESGKNPALTPNVSDQPHRRNPGLMDFYRLRRKGCRL